MVLKLNCRDHAVDESSVAKSFAAFLARDSTCLGVCVTATGRYVWRCGINQKPEATGYWIGGPIEVEKLEFLSFLIVQPRPFQSLTLQEAKRAWTDCAWRGRGLAAMLLREAAKNGPLISDFEGMTRKAFEMWSNVRGFRRYFMCARTGQLIHEADLPQEDRFGENPSYGSWHLVLQPEHFPPLLPPQETM